MLGCKAKAFRTHSEICLETLVPANNFYREVEAKLDLTFVRDLVRTCYSTHLGRPSIDPVVFFKLQLIMFFEGFRSERQLMEQVNLNLAYRWYIGYDLNESVPDHSSLSKIRERYGLEVFQRFFEQVVTLCIEAGLVWGKELYFDGTKVQANADIDGVVPRFYFEAKHHLTRLFAEPPPEEISTEPPPSQEVPRGFQEKYDGTRILSRRSYGYRRKIDSQVSPTDPDASLMKSSQGVPVKLGYHTHYVVDGGKARIILAVLVTPASIMDNTPMLDLERWVRFRWQLHPAIAVGDSKYGTTANIVGLEQDGIQPYMPIVDYKTYRKFYSSDAFPYDAERDSYLCPQNQELTLFSRRTVDYVFIYRVGAATCNACPVKALCTTSTTGRHVFRSFFQDSLDRAKARRDTPAYEKAMRKRKVWPEPLFGEAKQWHGLDKFRLRQLHKVNMEGLMIAAGQNLKRLLHHPAWPQPLMPAAAGAMDKPLPAILNVFPLFFSLWRRVCSPGIAPPVNSIRLSFPAGS